MLSWIRAFLIANVLGCAGLPAGYAQEGVMVTSSGSVAIDAADLDASRQAALDAAKRQSVSEVLQANVLPPRALAQHADQVDTFLLRDPDPYIAKLSIENEAIGESGEYEVRVTAAVREDAMRVALLENNIGDVFSMGPQPTVMVLVSERFETQALGTRVTETVLQNRLREAGLKIIDPGQRKLLALRQQVLRGPEAALQAATAFKADYLVLGEAVVTSSGPLSGTELKARYANLSVRIVESSSGQVVASEQGRGKAAHIDELTGGNWALEEASRVVGGKVVEALEALLKEALVGGTDIVVDIAGLQSPQDLEAIERVLAGVEGVKATTRRFYFEGVGQLEVSFKGLSAALATALSGSPIAGEPWEVAEILPRYLRIRRSGQALPARQDTEQRLERYLKEKYGQLEFERARARDQELAQKINALRESRRLSDAQKQELYGAQKALEKARNEAFYRERELAKRSEELEAAKVRSRQLEGLYRQRSEELDDLKQQLETVETERVQFEARRTALPQPETQQQERVLAEEQRRLEERYRRQEAERERVRQQQERARQVIYTSTQNQSNGETNRASAVAEWLKRIENGAEMWNVLRKVIGRAPTQPLPPVTRLSRFPQLRLRLS